MEVQRNCMLVYRRFINLMELSYVSICLIICHPIIILVHQTGITNRKYLCNALISFSLHFKLLLNSC